MLMIAFLLAASDPAPALSGEHRLTQTEIDKVLAEAAAKQEAADAAARAATRATAVPGAEQPREPIPVWGAVGVSVGSHGERSAYGTATVGMPGHGSATISIMGGREPYYYGPDYGPGYGPGYGPLP